MTEWTEIELGQCVNMLSGGTPSKDNDDFWNGDIPWASAKDLKSFLLHDTQDHITKIGSQNGTKIAPKGSILILIRGMTLHNDFPICRITQDMTFNQDIKAIIPDQSIIDTGYLAYWLLSSKYQVMSLVESASHGTGRINTNVLKSIKIPCPSLQKQKAVAQILEKFDAKIENLRRQNETLEAIAQTLFKHWFIDFEFPNADGKPYKSSGGAMIPSELGEIPEGWRVGKLGDLIDVRDGTHDSPKQSEKGFHLITSKHLKKEGIDFNSAYLISQADYIEINKRSKVETYDILLSMIGTVGLLYFVFDEDINFAIKNIGLFKTSKNIEYTEFIYLFLDSTYGKSYFKTRLAGTTQSYITLGSLREMPLIIPSSENIKKFKILVNPIFNKYYLNNKQIQTLTKTRDTLLPKLMSDQLRVKE
ncbi:restriction endonuclease subunit S [Nostoc sp. XA013]|nr:restriction endonuclease subunit S [Nostoc sp. XA013]